MINEPALDPAYVIDYSLGEEFVQAAEQLRIDVEEMKQREGGSANGADPDDSDSDVGADADADADVPFATVASLLTVVEGAGEEFAEVVLPSGKGKIKVRRLSRREALSIQGNKTLSLAQVEAHILAKGMVEPKLTFRQVEQWQDQPGNIRDLDTVCNEIARISGMHRGTPKSVV